MNPAVIAVLASLLVLCAQGQPDNKSSKCKCLNGYVGRVNLRLIKGEPVVHHPSIFCPSTEIIIRTTADKEKCVNPQSRLGQLILNNQNKHAKNGAVSTTTASSQTNTQSSTRLHTISKL
ncbi:C-X-C motif chemokine 10-like [Sebastes fasciatus]|uniref:C-X-C motif chemokine 10-like n=1 Tax=Sebastes fasciatus TaxID=394691 RepID=UPI003D9F6D5B